MDIQVGEHAINYADVAQKEKLSELQLRVRQLLDQVEQITKEQNYQRVSGREKKIIFCHSGPENLKKSRQKTREIK